MGGPRLGGAGGRADDGVGAGGNPASNIDFVLRLAWCLCGRYADVVIFVMDMEEGASIGRVKMLMTAFHSIAPLFG